MILGTSDASVPPMLHSGADTSIATADGPGSGRFLTLALLDALDGGSDLAAIRFDLVAPVRGAWTVGIGFAFHHEFSSGAEVIRAGVDPAGHVVAAELLRSARQPAARFGRQLALAAALHDGYAVESIHVESGRAGEPRSVTIIMENLDSFIIDLSDFERMPAPS
jgi:hypothetical protein